MYTLLTFRINIIEVGIWHNYVQYKIEIFFFNSGLQIPGISKSNIRSSNDKLIIAAVVMTAITLIITGLFWLLCVLPNIFWIYKVSNNTC